MKRILCRVLILSAGTGIAACSRPSHSSKPASITLDPCVVALAATDERAEIDRQIARLRDQARSGRNKGQAIEQLGYRLVARARTRNDPGDYMLAERAGECLASMNPDDSSALLLRGHVLHQMHRFREAEALARTLVAKRGMALDYGLLGDVLLEQGRVADGAAAYQQMIDLKPFYQSYIRAAHLRWLRGDLDGAIELIGMAIAAASPRDPESLPWAYTRLGLYELQAGRVDRAARAVNNALERQPDYAAALLARGRILLAARRYLESRDVLRRAEQLNPLPEYQWALADALRRSGLAAEAETLEHDLIERGSRSDPRTLALFLATRRSAASQAIALAQEELAARADIFTVDALAWALAAAGRIDEAAPLMQRALAEGTQDGRLFLHAAVIFGSAGQPDDARRWLAKAERLQTMLLPSELDQLETLRTTLSATQEN